MKKGAVTFVASAVLAIGLFSSFAYAQDKQSIGANPVKTNKVEVAPVKKEYNYMIKAMEQNGFKDAAEFMEQRDYDAKDNFMNNITDEGYNKMIDIMEDNGYEGMAKMMESVGRERMIKMHNAMGGSRACH